MKKWKEKWNSWSALKKVEWIISLLCGIGVIVLSLLQVLAIWKKAALVYEPLLCIMVLIQAHQSWRQNDKKTAIVDLILGLFLAVCYVIVVFLR